VVTVDPPSEGMPLLPAATPMPEVELVATELPAAVETHLAIPSAPTQPAEPRKVAMPLVAMRKPVMARPAEKRLAEQVLAARLPPRSKVTGC
jgi:hypothetical protein